MRQRFLTLLAILSVNLYFFAQELPEIIPPSPTVANLMQFEEVPISHYTGQPNISIPLYSKAIHNNVNLNVSLDYSTQGIKVDNRSGWTGTGWSLNAGGVISRTVRDVPDELLKNNYGYTGIKTGVYHLSQYWNYNNLNHVQKEEFHWNSVGTSQDKYDNDLDLYQFNFMGQSGRFVLIKNGSILEPKLISKGQNFKIILPPSSQYISQGYKIDSFKIIDPNGIIYEFNEVETSSVVQVSGSASQSGNQNEGVGVISAEQNIDDFQINTAWHLTSIKLPNQSTILTFNYNNVTESYISSISRTFNRIKSISPNPSNYYEFVNNSCNQSVLKPVQSLAYYSTTAYTKKLQSIVFNDGITLEFNSSINHPETNGARLNSLVIKNGATINKTYNFNYDVTSHTNGINSSQKLWLMGITEDTAFSSLPYTFYYNNKSQLPGFDSFLADDWGYYSGIGSPTVSCATNPFIASTISTGLLQSITYPTGGIKEFNFEHHSYSFAANQMLSYDQYMKNPLKTVAKDTILPYTYNNPADFGTNVLLNESLSFEQDIYITANFTGPSTFLNDHRLVITDANNSTRHVSLNENCTVVTNMPAGNFSVAFTYDNNLNTAIYTIQGSVTVYYTNPSSNPSVKEEMIGGGVRIKNVIFKEGLNVKRQINYLYEMEDPTKSSGVIDADLDRLTRNYTLTSTETHAIDPNFNQQGNFNVTYQVSEKGVRAQLSQSEYVGYRRVKIVEVESEKGSQVLSFTSAFDFPSPSETFNLPNPKPMPNLDFKRGLLIKDITFNSNNQKVKEVLNADEQGNLFYNFIEEPLFTILSSRKAESCPNYRYFDLYNSFVTGFPDGLVTSCDPSQSTGFYNNISCGFYDIVPISPYQYFTEFASGWAQPFKSTTKEYFYNSTNNQTMKQTTQEFFYNTSNYQVSQEDVTYLEKGLEEHFRTKYFYPVDGSVSSTTAVVKTKMVDLNIINTVLESKTFKVTGQGVNEVEIPLSETHNVHQEFSTNLVKPSEIKTLKGANLVESRILFNRYDIMGNVLEVSKTEGSKISYIWGHNKTKPVAQILNASFGDVELLLGNGFSSIDNLLQSHVNTLYNSLPNAQVTTFNYVPLIGVTSITDPRGYTSYFEYDDFNRLKHVKDEQGNILSENEYTYANQN